MWDAIAAMTNDESSCDDLDRLCRGAHYSRFHFAREFARLTGTTPRAFRAAVRLDNAKRLLLDTPFKISEVCFMAGYDSIGTFSTRFREAVGVTPREWRGQVDRDLPAASGGARLEGTVLSAGRPADVFVGVFKDTVVQGDPVAWTYTDALGRFVLHGVPDGQWRVALLGERCSATGSTQLRGYSRRIHTAGTQVRHLALNLTVGEVTRLHPPVLRAGLMPRRARALTNP